MEPHCVKSFNNRSTVEFGLWNRASSVVRQSQGEARICVFSFAIGTFAFFRARFFFAPPTLFWFAPRKRESAKKAWAPTAEFESSL